MRILLANLKHLCQRRGLWPAYVLLAFFVGISVVFAMDTVVDTQGAGEGKFIGLIVLAFLVGMWAAVLQMEILTKPFAFCLPGHRQTVKSFIFTIGVVTNLASAAAFLFYPGLFPGERLGVLCSAFFAGLIFYCTGVWLAFRLSQPAVLMGLLVFVMLGGRLLNLHILLEQAVVLYPVQIVAVGLPCLWALWKYLSDGNLARRNCLRPWMGFGDVFDAERLRKFQQARGNDPWKRLKDHPRPWVEAFFLGRMSRRTPFSMARFLWGSLYTSFAIPVSRSRYALVLALFIAIFLGYAGPGMWVMLAFVPLILVQAFASHPVLYSTMLTAGGRAERYASTLAVAVITAGLLVLLMGIIVAMSIPLAAVIPDIRVRGFTFVYHAVGLDALYVPLVFLPLACAIQMIFYRRPVLMIVMRLALIHLAMIVGIAFGKELAAIAGPGTAVVSWLIFASCAHRMAVHRDLVKR